jgi:hypothetical protein
MTRALGLAGIAGGALWIVWAVTGTDSPALVVAALLGFLAALWASHGRWVAAIGNVGFVALASAQLGLALMVLAALAGSDPFLVAGGALAVVALVVFGVLGARRLEGAPQWLLAFAAGSFSAIPLWEISFGLGFALLGAAVAWPEPETLSLYEETA